jgi:hypothetical protein
MENNKPRKIGFTILAFFYIFLHISKTFQKKKKEKASTVMGWIQPRRPRSRAKRARAPAPAVGFLQKGPRVID